MALTSEVSFKLHYSVNFLMQIFFYVSVMLLDALQNSKYLNINDCKILKTHTRYYDHRSKRLELSYMLNCSEKKGQELGRTMGGNERVHVE